MRVPTTMGIAFFNAAQNSPKTWQARQVMERAEHTMQGTKEVHSVTVHVSNKTRAMIAVQQGVEV